VKLILLLVLVLGCGIVIVLVEQHSAGRGLEQFLIQTRRITIGMTDQAVVDTLGPPQEATRIADNDREHESCRNAKGVKFLVYRHDYRGWFGGLGLSTGWEEFLVCIDKDGRVVDTSRVMMHVRSRMPVSFVPA
jgi:hypothetical protein